MPIPQARDIAEEDKLLVQQHVGSALRSIYEDTVRESLPERMTTLLELLAAQETCNERATIST